MVWNQDRFNIQSILEREHQLPGVIGRSQLLAGGGPSDRRNGLQGSSLCQAEVCHLVDRPRTSPVEPPEYLCGPVPRPSHLFDEQT